MANVVLPLVVLAQISHPQALPELDDPSWQAASLGFTLGWDEELRVSRAELDAAGNEHVTLEHFVHGLRVEGDRLRLHRRGGATYARESELSDLASFTYTPPRLSPWQAVAKASGGAELDAPTHARLVVLAKTVGLATPRLAYRVHVGYRRGERLPVARDVWIDALTGHTLFTTSRLYTDGTPAQMISRNLSNADVTLDVTTFPQSVVLKDIVSLPNAGQLWSLNADHGYVVYDTPSTSAPFADHTAVSAHDAMRRTLAFFDGTFGWRRFDFGAWPPDEGGLLQAWVHEGDALNNAYFTTTQTPNGDVVGVMAFGDGDGSQLTPLAACLDVVAHEVGHGVVQGTAELLYQFQSGALNESYADVFGWLADADDDEIGESCVGPGWGAAALRDMCDPQSIGQPAHMSDYVELDNTEEGDWGGVHTNSGIPNRAACLVKRATSRSVVGAIWFQALRHHLGPTSGFSDMARATLTACSELSRSTSECNAVGSAWVSVGLALSKTSGGCPPSSTEAGGVCLCDEGTTASGGTCAGTQLLCPANSRPVDDACYCNPGYKPDASGAACVIANEAPCPSHSHREAGTCVCDECYQGSPEGNGGGCQAVAGCVVCDDPLMTGADGSCACIAGVGLTCGAQSDGYDVEIESTTYLGEQCCRAGDPCGFGGDGFCDCVSECSFDDADCGGTTTSGPVCRGTTPGDCGNETWAGRCSGDLLVYCDDATQPSLPTLSYLRCADYGEYGCGLDVDSGYYDCVPVEDPCQGVPATGKCVGNTGKYCDGGALESADCGVNGCGSFTYDGSTFEYCLPCPPHSTLDEDYCPCDAGYQPNEDGSACDPIVDDDGDDDDGDDGDPDTETPAVCACDHLTSCEADCPCDPECACACDTTTACDAGCSCDPECKDDDDGGIFGCSAGGSSSLAAALMVMLLLSRRGWARRT